MYFPSCLVPVCTRERKARTTEALPLLRLFVHCIVRAHVQLSRFPVRQRLAPRPILDAGCEYVLCASLFISFMLLLTHSRLDSELLLSGFGGVVQQTTSAMHVTIADRTTQVAPRQYLCNESERISVCVWRRLTSLSECACARVWYRVCVWPQGLVSHLFHGLCRKMQTRVWRTKPTVRAHNVFGSECIPFLRSIRCV